METFLASSTQVVERLVHVCLTTALFSLLLLRFWIQNSLDKIWINFYPRSNPIKQACQIGGLRAAYGPQLSNWTSKLLELTNFPHILSEKGFWNGECLKTAARTWVWVWHACYKRTFINFVLNSLTVSFFNIYNCTISST